jgi:hypothetical protein
VVWFRVDDSFYEHPKFRAIPRRDRLAAIGLWCAAGAWCSHYLTDGRITHAQVMALGATPRLTDCLISAGLWVPVADYYQFHAWEEWQPTRGQVEAERLAARMRQRKRRSNEP